LADAYSHLFLWPQRFEPGWAGSEGILAARIRANEFVVQINKCTTRS
jgi:hypothetical protein